MDSRGNLTGIHPTRQNFRQIRGLILAGVRVRNAGDRDTASPGILRDEDGSARRAGVRQGSRLGWSWQAPRRVAVKLRTRFDAKTDT